MAISQEEIKSILTELEADLKKSQVEIDEKLSKADDEDKKPPEDSSVPATDAAESAEAVASAPPAADPAATMPPAPDAGASAGDMPPPDAAGAGDPAAEQQLTPEALQAEYAQLPPEELDMHIQAALAAKEALQGAAGAAAPGAGAPPPGMDAGAPPPMGKEELKINSEATGGKISKSEQVLSEVFAKFADRIVKVIETEREETAKLIKSQQEDIENLSKAVRTVAETPVRRAVTSIADVGSLKKSEATEMTTAEANDFIKRNAHKMTKSERDLWLSFVNGKAPAAKLAPMLERLASEK